MIVVAPIIAVVFIFGGLLLGAGLLGYGPKPIDTPPAITVGSPAVTAPPQEAGPEHRTVTEPEQTQAP